MFAASDSAFPLSMTSGLNVPVILPCTASVRLGEYQHSLTATRGTTLTCFSLRLHFSRALTFFTQLQPAPRECRPKSDTSVSLTQAITFNAAAGPSPQFIWERRLSHLRLWSAR